MEEVKTKKEDNADNVNVSEYDLRDTQLQFSINENDFELESNKDTKKLFLSKIIKYIIFVLIFAGLIYLISLLVIKIGTSFNSK